MAIEVYSYEIWLIITKVGCAIGVLDRENRSAWGSFAKESNIGCRVQELGKVMLELVIGRHQVEDRLLRFEGWPREGEWLSLWKEVAPAPGEWVTILQLPGPEEPWQKFSPLRIERLRSQ